MRTRAARPSDNIGRRWCLVPALLVVFVLWSAEAPASDPAGTRFRRLDSASGLSQDSVLAMAEDPHGWIWLATQDGLNRFDGYDVTPYRARAGVSGQLWSNWITSLAVGPRGNLWVGTSAGLFRRIDASDSFEPVPLLADGKTLSQPFIYAIHRDADDRIWVGSDAGLAMADASGDPGAGLPTRAWHAADDGAAQRIRAISHDAAGRLWLGSDRGLARFDPQLGVFEPTAIGWSPQHQPVNSILVDRAGAVWIATDQSGLYRLKPESGELLRFASDSPTPIASNRTHALHQSAGGSIWLGAETGAYRILDPDGAQPRLQSFPNRPHDPTSIGVGRVVSFLEVSDGSFWIGTWEGGAARSHPAMSRMLSFNPDMEATSALRDARTQALAADGDWLWLGTNRGVYRFHSRELRLEPIPALAEFTLFSLWLDPRGAWLGTGQGLFRYDFDGERVQPIEDVPELRGARIRRLFVDGDRLWLFAELHGLFVFDLHDLSLIAHHALPGNAQHITALDAQRVSVSATDGLRLFDRRDGRPLRFVPANRGGADGVLPNATSAILPLADGRIFAAAYGAGLLQLELPTADAEPAHAQLLASTPALVNNGLNSLLADRRGRLWTASDRGISMFDPASGRSDNFGADDGALTRGYYFSSAVRLDNGMLAFGSKHGFTLFDPEQLTWPAPPKAPVITVLEREGQAVAVASAAQASPLAEPIHRLSTISLPPGWGHSLGFRFASIDYVGAGRLRYLYRLEGFDSQWIEVDARRRLAGFTNLAPDRYRLTVKTIDPFGQESPETRLDIELRAWPWQTVWARLLGLLALAVLAALAWRRRTDQLLRRSQQLEDTVHERTLALSAAKREAETALENLQAAQQDLIRSEKLSALGQLVAGVAHEVNTPLGVALTASSHLGDEVGQIRHRLDGGKLSRSEFERYLAATGEGCEIIQRNLDRAAELIRNFKQVSVDRSAEGRRRFVLGAMLQELTQSLSLLWKGRPITLEVDCPASLTMDSFPGVIGQIITNLAQNAAIHAFSDTGPGHMRLQVRELPGARIELQFSDDGRGIAAEHLDRIFEPFYTTRRHAGGTGLGLHIVHNLVTEKLGGNIAVASMPEQGTRFTLTLPQTTP